MTRTIAIVEDDPQQRAHYADALRQQGYSVQEYGSRQEAQQAFEQVLPDLAILDIMLGQEIGDLFRIRQQVSVPIKCNLDRTVTGKGHDGLGTEALGNPA